MKGCYLLLGFFIVTSPLQAQIYKWTDANGNIHFSDNPHPGAKELQLPKVQTYSAPPIPPIETDSEPASNTEAQGYSKITIVQPEDQLTIRNTNGDFSIVTELEPQLKKGDKLQVIFDGLPLGEPQANTVISLHNTNRGSHTIAVQAVNSKNKVLITSDTITIFMMPPRKGMGKGAP